MINDDEDDEDDEEEDDEDDDNTASLVSFKDVMPSILTLLPLGNRPFFPGQAFPLLVDLKAWKETIKQIVDSDHKIFGLVLVHKDMADQAEVTDFYPMGTACRVHRISQSDDHVQILVEGLQRFHVEDWVNPQRPFAARVRYVPELRYDKEDDHIKAYVLAVINTIKELLPLNPLYGKELKMFLERFGPDNPAHLADFAASMTSSKKEELQEVLECLDLAKRMEKALFLLSKELELAKAQVEIRRQVEEKMHKQQREFFLREQLKAIQRELGIEKDDRTAEIDTFLERLKELNVPPAAQKRIDDEINKLSVLEVGSAEYGITRNYLDWLTLLPWGKYSKDKLDIKKARKVLDSDHEGLDDVKDRIVEFIGVGKLKGSINGNILLLVGPPGVGKTSIGRSIANAIGRSFYRFSVGGIHDEAEIKGHRRTYIGAMPGKFLQAMKEVSYANPVIMLDEIDKIGSSYRGDPASALLEVLDPEQNSDFLDHYLDVRFDLSKVLFVCTANQLDTIPSPLLDRMEVIRLSGYLSSEKLQIAKKHLLRKQLERAGLNKDQLKIPDATLLHIIEKYAREAGVRNLEKRLGTIARKAAIRLLEGETLPIKVTVKNLEQFLGKPLFEEEQQLAGVGIVTGLAWTAMGGATLNIEANTVHRYTRGFKFTGQLGDVMKESAEIAYSFIVSRSQEFGVPEHFFENAFIHLHVPAGATPKDGPSAGITMASALLSLAKQKPVSQRIAMTGELTLSGQVFPVGGIREKVIAARRLSIFTLILPYANKRDFDDLPDYIKEGVTIHFVKQFGDVMGVLGL
ncbi:endopeptidase La [Thioflexithrix psekupsensis]|uniref:Lon protease n=1 Tax=Thioflexithrix psekupsensis TaxID=1570016 RepID=A0A251XA57_9GAMM|nr:endopeptidase La [Thioflexithrix psekupsensis]